MNELHSSLESSQTTTTFSSTNLRHLTFIGEDDLYTPESDSIKIGSIVGFVLCAAGYFVVAALTDRLTVATRELYEWNAIRLIMPAILVFLGLECITLAIDYAGVKIPNQWAIAIYMFESTCAPGIFLATFVTTFLAYRTRSIPFCMVYRGPGRQNGTEGIYTSDEEEHRQTLVRPATMVVLIRLFALVIMVISFGVNFDVVWEEPTLAGRTGWSTIIQNGFQELNVNDHVVYSLLPMALVSLSCLYFSFLLWQYGNYYSMTLYPTGCNPWIYTFFGALLMGAGQYPGPDLFPVLSNAGILVYMISLLALLHEVRKDLLQASDLGDFLEAVGIDHVSNTIQDTPLETKYKGGSDILTEDEGLRQPV